MMTARLEEYIQGGLKFMQKVPKTLTTIMLVIGSSYEHGRWTTRGVKIDNGNEEVEVRMVEAESILATSDEVPRRLHW